MKRLLVLLVCLSMVLSVGCSKSEEEELAEKYTATITAEMLKRAINLELEDFIKDIQVIYDEKIIGIELSQEVDEEFIKLLSSLVMREINGTIGWKKAKFIVLTPEDSHEYSTTIKKANKYLKTVEAK